MVRLLMLTITLALAACEGAVRDPVGLGGGGDGTFIGGGGGGGGGGTGGGVLLGSWETNFVFQTSNDVQRHTVTWTFSAGGSCRRVVEIYSVLEDRTLTTTANCTFTAGGGEVAITYAGSSTAVSFSWSLEHFSSDRLILDGVIYDRIG
jgi:hypothetical protein